MSIDRVQIELTKKQIKQLSVLDRQAKGGFIVGDVIFDDKGNAKATYYPVTLRDRNLIVGICELIYENRNYQKSNASDE